MADEVVGVVRVMAPKGAVKLDDAARSDADVDVVLIREPSIAMLPPSVSPLAIVTNPLAKIDKLPTLLLGRDALTEPAVTAPAERIVMSPAVEVRFASVTLEAPWDALPMFTEPAVSGPAELIVPV